MLQLHCYQYTKYVKVKKAKKAQKSCHFNKILCENDDANKTFGANKIWCEF